MKDLFLLVYDEHEGIMKLVEKLPEHCVLIDSFERYDDAMDALADIRALCVGGTSMKDVIEMTYGEFDETEHVDVDDLSVLPSIDAMTW